MTLLPVIDIDPTYENVRATCPGCSRRNIFNRVTDLNTTDAISGLDVCCLFCATPFRITNDRINVPHEALLFDCADLLADKRYMQCVLSTAQSYEMFFSQYFRVQGLYRPHALLQEPDPRRLEALASKLYEFLKRMTFVPMRSLFLDSVSTGFSPKTLTETKRWLDALPTGRYPEPPKAILGNVSDSGLRALLVTLYDTNVATIRNNVVHKDAYRPTQAEAAQLLQEAKDVLFRLTSVLKLGGSASWYLNHPGR